MQSYKLKIIIIDNGTLLKNLGYNKYMTIPYFFHDNIDLNNHIEPKIHTKTYERKEIPTLFFLFLFWDEHYFCLMVVI